MTEETFNGGEDFSTNYTIIIDQILDGKGYVVEIIDKMTLKTFVLSHIYLEEDKAIIDANLFVNNLEATEQKLYIN